MTSEWRRSFLQIILVLGAAVLLVFGWVYSREGRTWVAMFEWMGAASMLISLVAVVKKAKLFWPSLVGWVGLLGVLMMLVVTGGIGGTGLVWWGLLPVVSYVMLGVRGGWVAQAIGSFALAGLLGARMTGWTPIPIYFEPIQIRQALIFYVVLWVIMHYYEKMAGGVRDEAMQQRTKLEREKDSRAQIEEELRLSMMQLKEEQQEQNKTKTAMLNLLEDAKSLEEQLVEEKAGVEKQVKERTRELSEERAELVAVINSIARGLVVVDKSWQVILKNETIGKLMKVNKNITYLDLATFLQPQFALDKMVAESFAQNHEVRLEPKVVGNRYFDVHTVPVLHGEQVGAVAIFVKDVTETVSLQRSRDEFFSIASHELRTPLTAIRGNTEMILDNYKEKIQDKDVLEMLADVHEGSVRLIEIVNDFLNVSRLEMGKLEFKLAPLGLVDMSKAVVKEFEMSGSLQQVAIKVDGDEVMVSGDMDRVKQVLINLVGNALKFTKKGEVSLSVGVSEGMGQVLVTDTGEGIPKEQQGLLFHKFQQAGSSLYTRDTSKGTGLGLYISKLMMEGMGGEIELVKSEPGVGSTFAINLPLVKA